MKMTKKTNTSNHIKKNIRKESKAEHFNDSEKKLSISDTQLEQSSHSRRRIPLYNTRVPKTYDDTQSESSNGENNQPQYNTMSLTLNDIIKFDIPFFKGDPKELNGFINTCSMYNQLTPNPLKNTLLTIIKTKITGEALAKIQPIDNYTNWIQLKDALRTRVKNPYHTNTHTKN